jgi:cytochrome c oxidase cbb3-type subunit 3
MPAYPHLISQSFAPIASDVVQQQAREVAGRLNGGMFPDARWDQEMVAVIAYLNTIEPDFYVNQPAEPSTSVPLPDATDPAQVASGERHFGRNCAVCHGADLTGTIGPSLRDDVWIHGGEVQQIQQTIITGVPDRGCPSWKAVLPDSAINDLAAFIYAASHPE